MTALSVDRNTTYRDGVEIELPVYQSVKIYAGSLVCVNGSGGYAIPAADASGNIFMGVAMEQADNSSGSSGDITVRVRRKGVYKFGASSITQAMVGDLMYVVDDQTIDETSPGNSVVAGILVKYVSATVGWIDIEAGCRVGAAIAATAISVADSANYFEAGATTAEAVLAEIGAELAAYNRGRLMPAVITGEDGTALTKFTAGATPGWQQLSNKECVLTWDGNAGPTKVAIQFFIPDDLDGTADVSLHCLAAMAGAVDAPTLTCEAYFNIGDTDCMGTDDVVDGGVTLTEYSSTIANADVPDTGPAHLTIVMGPTGTMTTDELRLYAVWLEYAKVKA